MAIKAGQLVTDGTVTWIIDDVRDGVRVGDIILRSTLRDGYIKANGATVKASEYPRLLAWVLASNMTVTAEQYKTDCSKYVYDAAQDKLTLPNVVGRVLQGGDTVKSVEAGLPNITGGIGIRGAGSIDGAWLSSKATGAFANAQHPTVNAVINNTTIMEGYTSNIDMNASRSNPIYGRSATVQPPAITMIAQIKY